MSLVTDEMRSAIGRSLGTRTSPPVTATDIRRWAMAVYYPATPPPLFWDEEYAATTRWGGIVAPEDFNAFSWLISPAREAPVAQDADSASPFVRGPEANFGIASPELRFQLNGGVATTYTGVRIRPGDSLTSDSAIAEFNEREGRLGPMLFTVSASRLTNQRDELIKTSRSTLIRY